jgi:hypothetical protein
LLQEVQASRQLLVLGMISQLVLLRVQEMPLLLVGLRQQDELARLARLRQQDGLALLVRLRQQDGLAQRAQLGMKPALERPLALLVVMGVPMQRKQVPKALERPMRLPVRLGRQRRQSRAPQEWMTEWNAFWLLKLFRLNESVVVDASFSFDETSEMWYGREYL